jgi:hypothetical protein
MRGWFRILTELEETVDRACSLCGGRRVILVGHSSGGVMGRLYLSPEPLRGHVFGGVDKVQHLISLGSPHRNVRGARIRRWVDRTYPGAFFSPRVRYTAVAGKALEGRAAGGLKERTAYFLYRQLSGSGDEWGDGIVPLSSAVLPGARNLELDGVGHAPVGGSRWYGSRGVVERWWKQAMATGGPGV